MKCHHIEKVSNFRRINLGQLGWIKVTFFFVMFDRSYVREARLSSMLSEFSFIVQESGTITIWICKYTRVGRVSQQSTCVINNPAIKYDCDKILSSNPSTVCSHFPRNTALSTHYRRTSLSKLIFPRLPSASIWECARIAPTPTMRSD